MSGEQFVRRGMKRREVPGGIRYLTFSCQERLKLFSNVAVARVFVDAMVRARVEKGMKLYAWVVMPEHVHMLVRAPEDGPLGPVLAGMKVSVSKRVIGRWIELGATEMLKRVDDGHGTPRFWLMGGGFDRNVRDSTEFSREVRYIHHNPVERGLVSRPEEWEWSSVRWWMGKREGEVECDPPPGKGWERWKGYV